MIGASPENVQKLRGLAAQLRGYAEETDIIPYRRKFESVASELEEEAEAEIRILARGQVRLDS
jgi:hypothetical protein